MQILVPLDGSATATLGLREAIQLARGRQARIHLLHVVDRLSLAQGLHPALIIRDIIKGMECHGRNVLEAARATVEKEHLAVQATLKRPARGSVADEILRQARRLKADLVVMGTHGWRGANSVVMGSTAQDVIRTAEFPVLLVKARAGDEAGGHSGRSREAYRRILVPIDGSPAGEAGVRAAIRFSRRPGSTIRLLYVLEPHPVLQGMEVAITKTLLRNKVEFGAKILKKAKALLQRYEIPVEIAFNKLVQQPAADGISAEVRKWKPDLLVMGTHGRSGISRAVLGSDAESVVRACTIPVIVVCAR